MRDLITYDALDAIGERRPALHDARERGLLWRASPIGINLRLFVFLGGVPVG
jgi:hypothetical protein